MTTKHDRIVHTRPRVSICIPTYNGARYLAGALTSALQQTYSDFEIIIVDNCSTDNTENLVEAFLKHSEKISFFRNDRNIGLAENLNKCLSYARGKYIKYLCVDDLLHPECLERMVAALDAHPAVSLVCGGRMSIDEAGHPFGFRRYPSRRQVIPGPEATSRCLFGKNFIGEPTAVMFRKSEAKSRFRDDLPQLMDMEMWFKLLENGALLSISDPLCSIRFHNGQMTRENIKLGRIIDDNVRIFNELAQKSYLKITPMFRLQHRLMMTYRVWISKDYITDDKRIRILGQYGSTALYLIMPALHWSLTIKRKIGVK